MKKTLSLIIATAMTFAALPAKAEALNLDLATTQSLDLQAAKKKGLVGEKNDGLIGAVFSNPDASVTSLVNLTNQGRMAVYQEMAAKQGLTINQVQEIAATKLYAKETPGNYIQINGEWGIKK